MASECGHDDKHFHAGIGCTVCMSQRRLAQRRENALDALVELHADIAALRAELAREREARERAEAKADGLERSVTRHAMAAAAERSAQKVRDALTGYAGSASYLSERLREVEEAAAAMLVGGDAERVRLVDLLGPERLAAARAAR